MAKAPGSVSGFEATLITTTESSTISGALYTNFDHVNIDATFERGALAFGIHLVFILTLSYYIVFFILFSIFWTLFAFQKRVTLHVSTRIVTTYVHYGAYCPNPVASFS